MKYRKRPVEVKDARQWFTSHGVSKEFGVEYDADNGCYCLPTNCGSMLVNSGDWIVTGLSGEKWVVEQKNFPLYYEGFEP